jgi:hypothetical protein
MKGVRWKANGIHRMITLSYNANLYRRRQKIVKKNRFPLTFLRVAWSDALNDTTFRKVNGRGKVQTKNVTKRLPSRRVQNFATCDSWFWREKFLLQSFQNACEDTKPCNYVNVCCRREQIKILNEIWTHMAIIWAKWTDTMLENVSLG